MELCFLWHMHQPFYKNLVSGRYEMPWVRLHGTKDYYDMVAILDDFPGVKQTFNLVPSLLEQLEEYSRGEALDDHLELSRKPAASLTDVDKEAILADFFKANYETMIKPRKRYDRLYHQKATGKARFTGQDWLDLQIWSNLAWIDPIFQEEEPVKKLLQKGEKFTEEDKSALLDFQRQVLGRIIPKYREICERGQIELSVSPYFHPILPLLCDTDIAKQSTPQVLLPKHRFARPDDAQLQVEMAIGYFESKFGHRPKGMWPSEGSVSEQIIPIVAEAGIEWIASDEEILALSLGKSIGFKERYNGKAIPDGHLYKPYVFEAAGKRMHLFFRDHMLSDLIGFVYSRMEAKQAAADFVAKLEMIDQRTGQASSSQQIVCVALDGENAWEYFPEDGHAFLREFYSRLSEHPRIKTCTLSEALQRARQAGSLGPLPRLHPGSWINHNFSIWIGHPEDNKAWDLLYEARKVLDEAQAAGNIPQDRLELARKEIMIAEGSDWCWWFGDEHDSPDNDRFDQLYRSHLMNVYILLGRPVPQELLRPIRTDYIRAHLSEPVDFVKPTIDGKLTHYYEWSNAGMFDCRKAGSTMHKASQFVNAIYYGYGEAGQVYLRVDPAVGTDIKSLKLKFEFSRPEGLAIVIENGQATASQELGYLECRAGKLLELGFSAKAMGGENSAMRLTVLEGEREVERWPVVDTIPVRPDLAAKQYWGV